MSVIAGWGFVLLPDTDSAVPLARRLARGSAVPHHPSGRPWLVHNYPAEQVAVSADRSERRLAVVGFSAVTPAGLSQAVRHLDGPDRLARELGGSFWVVASFAGRSYALGVRRIYRARIDGVWVASDRADVLTEMGSFDFDETTRALRTIMPLVHPLPEEPLWRGFEPVAPGDSLTIEVGAAQRVAFESPLLDDRVVEACLATRIPGCGHPKQVKPLIREAMRGLLPEDFLRRNRKTSGDPQASRGIRAAESELVGICRHSVLAERGIIDLDELRSHAFGGRLQAGGARADGHNGPACRRASTLASTPVSSPLPSAPPDGSEVRLSGRQRARSGGLPCRDRAVTAETSIGS
ncbi:asparagine synthase-related protein [Micromonospora matsumotoense]|uniref:asparagine synthase-related protein n=1 Tax=Micromonospora matsumotoense TaxID=121616 RepID=UPI003D925893